MVSHSKMKIFTLPSTPPHPFILRGAEGEVAESILQQTTLPSEGQVDMAALNNESIASPGLIGAEQRHISSSSKSVD